MLLELVFIGFCSLSFQQHSSNALTSNIIPRSARVHNLVHSQQNKISIRQVKYFPYNASRERASKLYLGEHFENKLCRPTFLSSSFPFLFADIFGLGPTEVVIIAAAALLLFGPGKSHSLLIFNFSLQMAWLDRLKSQLRERGVKGAIVSEGWRAEREERIKELRTNAEVRRKARAMKFLQEAIAQDVPEVVDLVDEFNDAFSDSKGRNR